MGVEGSFDHRIPHHEQERRTVLLFSPGAQQAFVGGREVRFVGEVFAGHAAR